jgi:hypothetical protein
LFVVLEQARTRRLIAPSSHRLHGSDYEPGKGDQKVPTLIAEPENHSQNDNNKADIEPKIDGTVAKAEA